MCRMPLKMSMYTKEAKTRSAVSLVKKCETMYLPSQIRMPAQMTNTMQVAGKLPTS